MADKITLPPRANSIQFDDDEIQDIFETLQDVTRGEAVIVRESQETSTKARDRAKRVKEILSKKPFSVNVKAHAVEAEDGTFIPAVSLAKPTPTTTTEK